MSVPDQAPAPPIAASHGGEEASRRASAVLFSMCVIIAVTQLGFGAIVPVLPLYAKSFGVSASAIGLTIAIYGLARLVMAIPCGTLSDAIVFSISFSLFLVTR